MTTAVETGLGSTFKLANAGGTLTLVGEPTNIPIPTGTTDLLDASHYASVGYKDYIAAPLKDGEEADLAVHWLPGSATDTLLNGAVNSTRAFEIVVPAGTGATSNGSYKFAGNVLVRSYARQNPFDAVRMGTLRVKWVGNITETYTAPV